MLCGSFPLSARLRTSMADPIVWLTLLVIVTACVLAMTITVVLTAWEFRRTLRRANAILPGADRAIREAHRSLEHIRRLLIRTNDVSRHVEAVIHQACDAASDTLRRFLRVKEQAQAFWAARLGNGAGAEPRQHHRRR